MGDLIVDCIDVVQQVDLPLLVLPTVVVCNLRLPSLLLFQLGLEPGATNQSLKGQIQVFKEKNQKKNHI